MTTRRAAQDSNPSHGAALLTEAKARNPTAQRMTGRVAPLAQAHDSDGHSCRLSRGKAAAE